MNKVVLMGRLTKDPEIRYTANNNTAVCNFTLAVNRRFSKQGEERQADFIPIVVWSKLAEFCSNYFSKGRQVAVVGRIQTRTWDDNDGKRHYVTEVIAEEAFFADSRKEGSQGGSNNQNLERKESEPVDFGENKKEDATDGFYPLEEDDDLPF